MSKNDDTIPDGSSYPYYWSSNSTPTLLEFTASYRPSMVQNDGTKPWIWVQGSEPPKSEADEEAAVEEALALLDSVSQEVERIKNDPAIPVRSSKKTGAKSKKEVREEAQAAATEKLKEISIRHKYVSGKWLIFAPPEKVDTLWLSVAQSLAGGPLSRTKAYLAKVATSPRADTPNYQHVICIYLPDVYDQNSVTEVMKVLLRDHGLNLSGVKSNLYTHIGLDSKHPSGIPSTVWKNTALLKDTEIKDLKDAYFSALKTTPTVPPTSRSDPAPSSATDASPAEIAATAKNEGAMAKAAEAAKAPVKKKLLRKRKADQDDPFASDDEASKAAVKPNSKPSSQAAAKPTSSAKPPSKAQAQGGPKKPSSRKAPLKKRKVDEDEFVSAEE